MNFETFWKQYANGELTTGTDPYSTAKAGWDARQEEIDVLEYEVETFQLSFHQSLEENKKLKEEVEALREELYLVQESIRDSFKTISKEGLDSLKADNKIVEGLTKIEQSRKLE